MNQDEIIEMARQAGFTVGYGSPALPKHEAFAKLVAAKEREACAKLAEDFQRDYVYTAELAGHVAAMKHRLADAIRARGEA